MIDTATIRTARRRPRSEPAFHAPVHLFSRRLPSLIALGAACVVLAACSAQNTRGGVTASVVNPNAPAPAAAPVVAAETPSAEKTAAAKPVSVAGKVYASTTRKLKSFGVGLASWYGDRFHGRRTANGEMYDMQALTAAHPSMPLPSYARVTNVSNGRSVIVRVNDRGPFHGGRLIDVSRKTADVLGFRSAGVGNVKVDYVGPAAPDGHDDRKLIATYQEFGRPTAPEGVQLAALRPVSDAELVGGAPAAATLVASAAPNAKAVTVAGAGTAIPVGLRTTTPITVAAYAQQPAEQASALGAPLAGKLAPRAAAAVVPTPVAHPATAAQQVAAVVAPKSATPKAAKRVVEPAEPVLASVAPQIGGAVEPAATPAHERKGDPAVSARIAASFEGFDDFAPGKSDAPVYGSPGAFTGLR